MAGLNSAPAPGGKQKVGRMQGWPVEYWTAALVIIALALLILIRRGFRGVNVAGLSASISRRTPVRLAPRVERSMAMGKVAW